MYTHQALNVKLVEQYAKLPFFILPFGDYVMLTWENIPGWERG